MDTVRRDDEQQEILSCIIRFASRAVLLLKVQNSIDKGVDNELLMPPVTFIMVGMVLYESIVVDERSDLVVDNKSVEVT